MLKIKNRYTGEVMAEGSTKEICRSGANLRGADLSGADLSGADLRGADLREAKYGDEQLLKFFTIGPIGSRNDYLQVFITDTQTILRTGCWTGTIEELANRTDRADYHAAIQFISTFRRGEG